MAFEQKDMTFSLFRNEDPKSEKSPTHSGRMKVHGKEFDIAAWVRETSGGKKYFSGTIKPKEWKDRAEAPKQTVREELNDDIPW